MGEQKGGGGIIFLINLLFVHGLQFVSFRCRNAESLGQLVDKRMRVLLLLSRFYNSFCLALGSPKRLFVCFLKKIRVKKGYVERSG